MKAPTIRVMNFGDIAFVERQKRREGWDVVHGGVALHMDHDPDGCFIAQWHGRPVGMITTTRYANSAFLGNLIVEPACRRMGLGEALMRRAMEHLHEAGCRTLWLEADAPGIRLYRRLGFVDVFESLRFEVLSPPRVRIGTSDAVRTVERADLKAIARLDGPVFGDDRSHLLAALIDRAPAAMIAERRDRPAGFIITQSLADGVRIGPFVAVDENVAAALLDAVLAGQVDRRFTAGLPAVAESSAALFTGRGFHSRTSSVRMVHGERAYDGRPQRIYGIAGGDRG